ncbi:PEP-CTERM sorting domain-containing protein [Duganella sp. FT80W]|uniref:PEP-CTERM sorting domain-containing protein n=1 Tax=Duganella guangzhouensis TaxID=2666084 RepID=A0A6I2L964_9BURK|nr:FxDxF family PEP-CTERM protein [Duganella guangzhouensis]MRW94815.1 PEP-CTERM sorting domain-containing protein [Duganella guangzhouensis]
MQKASSAIQFMLLATLPVGVATAADFPGTISSSTSAQKLAAGQSGTVGTGGSLIVSGDKVAVTITGNGATLNNLGTISQTGTGRGIRDNTGVTDLVVNNGSTGNTTALIQTADADVIQMAKASASVILNNYGSMISLNASGGGNQVVDFNAVTGTNIVNNYGLLQATEADAVRPGLNGVVNNYGSIKSSTTTGSSSDGVDLQANTGIQVFNYATGLIQGGRHGITGGPDSDIAFTVSVTNAAGATISGLNGSGINLDGYSAKQTATIVNNGTIIGNGVTGDGDGVDADGVANITNTGIIRSVNAYSAVSAGLAYSEGISVGGGTIINSGTIEGLVDSGNTNAVGRGITLAGNDKSDGTREGLYANAVITNQANGVIRGQSDSAIVVSGVASGHTVTINNYAGASIIGGGTANAAIKGNADDTTIVTGGIINGSSSGKAIELGSGVNSVTITGGTISGSINGGGSQSTLTVAAGSGSFAYAGAISNFNKVEIQSGTVTFSGVSSYGGATVLSGGELVLDGAQRLSSTSELILNGGTLQLNNAGATGQTFASLTLSSDSVVKLGGSTLTFGGLGAVVSGATLSFTQAASGSYAFRLLGDYSSNTSFLALLSATTVNGLGATYSYDGSYTTVLAAVPEPSTYAMLFAGLGLVGAIARRRRTKV